jgi:hypothetical protein
MEVMLRCALPDVPGALAELAGVIARCDADIEAVEVVEVTDGRALDDLVVVVSSPGHLRELLDRLEDGAITVVHAAPSRGHPGDGVTRLAVGLQSILSGAMEPDRGLATLAGGLLRADTVTVVPVEQAPPEGELVAVARAGGRAVVVHRSYGFTRTERERLLAVVRVVAEAATEGSPR